MGVAATSAAMAACGAERTPLPSESPAAPLPPGSIPTRRFLVIGAGAAGLAAAGRLREAGLQVEVLEARDRLGGRIHTTRAWPDLPVDMGASWVHGDRGNPLTPIVQAAGARTISTSYDSAETYVSAALATRGLRKPQTSRWESAVAAALGAAEDLSADVSLAAAIERMPWWARLSEVERADLGFYLASTYETEWGLDSARLSAWRAEDGREFQGDDRLFPDGFSSIVDHMAQGLSVRLSAPVSRIRMMQQSVLVTVNGVEETAAAVLVTVPLGVLQAGSLSIEPGIASETRAAIDRLGVGVLSKTFLRFERTFWPPDLDWHEYVGERPGHWAEWVSFTKAGPPVMLGFNSGANAARIEAAPDQTVIAESMTALRDMFGAGIPEPVGVQTSRWSLDPWARGSYSAMAVGSTREDRLALARPIADRIFWAGEATEPDYFGTVHGAVLSGWRAADEIVKRYG